MAKHIAYLFLRDPLLLYGSRLEQDPDKDTDHLEVRRVCVLESMNMPTRALTEIHKVILNITECIDG